MVILTGCTTLVTSFDRIRAMMTPKEETNEEINNYGAWFTSAQSLISELPSELSGPSIRRGQEAKGCLGRRPSVKDRVQYKTLRNRGEKYE
jgi:hypothetical protein